MEINPLSETPLNGFSFHSNPNKWTAKDNGRQLVSQVNHKEYKRHIDYIFDTLNTHGITPPRRESLQLHRLDNCFDSYLSNPYNKHEPLIKTITPLGNKEMRRMKNTEHKSSMYYGNKSQVINVYDKTALYNKQIEKENKEKNTNHALLTDNIKRDEHRIMNHKKLGANLSQIDERFIKETRDKSFEIIKNTLYSRTPIIVNNETIGELMRLKNDSNFKFTYANILTHFGAVHLRMTLDELGINDIRDVISATDKQSTNALHRINQKLNEVVQIENAEMLNIWNEMRDSFLKSA